MRSSRIISAKSIFLNVQAQCASNPVDEDVADEMRTISAQLDRLRAFTDDEIEAAMASRIYERAATIVTALQEVDLGNVPNTRLSAAKDTTIEVANAIVAHKPGFDASRDLLNGLLPLAQMKLSEIAGLSAEEGSVRDLVSSIEEITLCDVDIPYVLTKLGAPPAEHGGANLSPNASGGSTRIIEPEQTKEVNNP